MSARIRIADLRAREAAATPGPWHHDTAKQDERDVTSPDLVVGPAPYDTLAVLDARGGQEHKDAALIAVSRNALLALIEAVETARQVERATTGTVSFEYGDWPGLRKRLARFDFGDES